jgi:exodeoxyribonuclease V alpha subunit
MRGPALTAVDFALGAALNTRGACLLHLPAHRNSELMLVGDPDQLPPVGAGQPVADALAEGLLPCIDLRQIYRTAANSAIVTSAHAINRGKADVLLGPAHDVWRPAQCDFALLRMRASRPALLCRCCLAYSHGRRPVGALIVVQPCMQACLHAS